MPFSKNYRWSLTNLLGTGAVGEVYSGYNLSTGESVAIKVMKNFTRGQLEHLLSLQERELEVLRKLDHPNIVKLLDVEPENVNANESNLGRKIIVMELCTGGSLFNLISNPENIFGLEDKEFLRVLEGIALGMEKLHQENIVHRDIKPGNIMRFIGEDGRTTYKLIDFGAARELHPEQEFETIYGTEEYLHPGLYEKAFIDKYSEQSFEHSVDLWSIGATLYHVAAGQIPFQSYNGRKDRSTMHEIIANKKSGDISGIQEVRNGEIIYDQHLPAQCIMSTGLRPYVEKLLARLLETDKSKIMSFEEFFSTAKNIINKKVVAVFHSETTDILRVYMDPSCIFHEFQKLLEIQTKVEPKKQMLLYENLNFSEQFKNANGIMSCGEVVDSNPVYLFHGLKECRMCLDDSKYSIPDRTKIREHLNFSRHCCESLHFIRRNIARCLLRQKLIDSGAIMLIRFLGRKFDKFSVKLEHLAETAQLQRRRIESVELLISLLLSTKQEVANKAKNSLSRQKDLYLEIEAEIKTLQNNSMEMELGLQSAVSLWVEDKPSCKGEECCLSRIDVAIKKVMEINESFVSKSLTNEYTHLKCQKLENICNAAKSQIENHCQVNSKQLVATFRTFLGTLWSQKEGLETSERSLENQYQRHSLLLESMDESFQRLKQTLGMPALNLESLPPDSGDRSLTVEEGKLVLRRRESIENKCVRQLYSLSTNVDNEVLASHLAPMAEENNVMINKLMKIVQENLSATVSTVDGKAREKSTFQIKVQMGHEDKTLT